MLPFPNHIRVQAILPGLSGLPRDRFINTFHFKTNGDVPVSGPDLASAQVAVADFYRVATAPGAALGTWLSKNIDRGTNKCIARAYDLGELEPRTPSDYLFTLAAPTFVDPLPNEVAACLSYFGNANVASQRGRIYVGPLSIQALQTEANAPDIKDDLRTAMLRAADALATSTTLTTWVILKPALPERPKKGGGTLPARGNSSVEIQSVWVDDEFDTQRRRGLKARSRVTATLAGQ